MYEWVLYVPIIATAYTLVYFKSCHYFYHSSFSYCRGLFATSHLHHQIHNIGAWDTNYYQPHTNHLSIRNRYRGFYGFCCLFQNHEISCGDSNWWLRLRPRILGFDKQSLKNSPVDKLIFPDLDLPSGSD